MQGFSDQNYKTSFIKTIFAVLSSFDFVMSMIFPSDKDISATDLSEYGTPVVQGTLDYLLTLSNK
jgi:hypothetical protein